MHHFTFLDSTDHDFIRIWKSQTVTLMLILHKNDRNARFVLFKKILNGSVHTCSVQNSQKSANRAHLWWLDLRIVTHRVKEKCLFLYSLCNLDLVFKLVTLFSAARAAFRTSRGAFVHLQTTPLRWRAQDVASLRLVTTKTFIWNFFMWQICITQNIFLHNINLVIIHRHNQLQN